MTPIDPLTLVLLLTLGIVLGVVLAGLVVVPRLLRTLSAIAPPPADPLAQLVQQTGALSGVLKIWQDQLTALAAQMERIEKEKHELEERADHLENLNRKLGESLIAQCDHCDAVYKALETFEAGRGWAAGFRKDDPRYKQTSPPPAP